MRFTIRDWFVWTALVALLVGAVATVILRPKQRPEMDLIRDGKVVPLEK